MVHATTTATAAPASGLAHGLLIIVFAALQATNRSMKWNDSQQLPRTDMMIPYKHAQARELKKSEEPAAYHTKSPRRRAGQQLSAPHIKVKSATTEGPQPTMIESLPCTSAFITPPKRVSVDSLHCTLSQPTGAPIRWTLGGSHLCFVRQRGVGVAYQLEETLRLCLHPGPHIPPQKGVTGGSAAGAAVAGRKEELGGLRG